MEVCAAIQAYESPRPSYLTAGERWPFSAASPDSSHHCGVFWRRCLAGSHRVGPRRSNSCSSQHKQIDIFRLLPSVGPLRSSCCPNLCPCIHPHCWCCAGRECKLYGCLGLELKKWQELEEKTVQPWTSSLISVEILDVGLTWSYTVSL